MTETTLLQDIARAVSVLEKRKMQVVRKSDSNVVVIYNEGGKTKLGIIRLPYYHRYGVGVLATFNGKRFWFQSNAVADEVDDATMEAMQKIHAGETVFPAFDIKDIGEVFW